MALELRVAHIEELVAQRRLEVRELRAALSQNSEKSEASYSVISEPPLPLTRAAAGPAGSYPNPFSLASCLLGLGRPYPC